LIELRKKDHLCPASEKKMQKGGKRGENWETQGITRHAVRRRLPEQYEPKNTRSKVPAGGETKKRKKRGSREKQGGTEVRSKYRGQSFKSFDINRTNKSKANGKEGGKKKETRRRKGKQLWDASKTLGGIKLSIRL